MMDMAAEQQPEPQQLVRYDTMCRAIAEAYQVDEVKDIRDRAIALEEYARQAKNEEMVRQCAEIRLRAERRAGELLAQMDKVQGARGNPGGRGARIVASSETSPQKTMAELHITHDQASRWQQLAKVPEEQFEAAIAKAPIPTTKGVLRATRAEVVDVEPRADKGDAAPAFKPGPHAECIQLDVLARRWDDEAIAAAIMRVLLAAGRAPDAPGPEDGPAQAAHYTIMELERWAGLLREERI